MTIDSTYYTITYTTQYDRDEMRTTLISSPHSIDRTKEILAETHPEWEITSVNPTDYPYEKRETLED